MTSMLKWKARSKKVFTRLLQGFVCIAMSTVIACQSSYGGNPRTQDLLLPLEALPSSWELSGPPRPMGPHVGFGDEDDTYVRFKLASDKYIIASQYVLRYPTVRQAETGYLKLARSRFNDNSIAIDMPWQTPAELSFMSPYAGQLRMACTINNIAGRNQVCELMGQYGKYVTIFSSSIRPDTLSLAEFNQVAQRIDEIMARELKLDQVQ